MSNVFTKSQKRFVVVHIASGKGLVETARAFQREYAFLPSIQQLQRYDATSLTGSLLSDELKKLFFKVYERAQNDLHLVPNAHAAIRARRIEDEYNNALVRGDHKTEVALLIEARKNAEPFAWDPDAGDDDEGETA